ncbi:MAG: DUF1257 domain-containing protein [Acidobacteria bacterium]|nr:DUF1257 domain-containing protein [Acidobacteriota bacterium]
MSHVVSVKTVVRDPAAVAAACQRLQLPAPVFGTAELYSGAATGLVVQLPGWQYPIVCDTQTGTIQFDNFNGYWGEQAHFDRFLQAYAVEKAKLEASKKGLAVSEEALQDGSIKVQIIEGC